MARKWKNDMILVAAFIGLAFLLYQMPTGFEKRIESRSVRCKGRVIKTDDTNIQQFAMVKQGDQSLTIRLLDGPFKGREVKSHNQLLGLMDRDTVFGVGDTALVVLSLGDQNNIVHVQPRSYYRIGPLMWLMVLFAVLLLGFGGWIGFKALLSFVFSALMIWKILVPWTLKGYDPIWVTLAVVTLLTATIIFLVAGLTRKGLAAFLGSFFGILTGCLLAVYFTTEVRVHAATMPFAETLLYAGYGHLNLVKIYVAAVFLAASGAVMDLAMDVAASLDEVVSKKPDISTMEAIKSGFSVGRAVVGTMTTTLLLAYSGGYITLLMAFMAQGIPLTNMLNLIYVAAEVLKTLVGSFGLVAVAPFTAVIGAVIFTRGLSTERIKLLGDKKLSPDTPT